MRPEPLTVLAGELQLPVIACVVPAYKVNAHIDALLRAIGPEVSRIYVVDDACPAGSGRQVEQNCSDPRVKVLYNPVNLGVGGAVLHGYRVAIADGADLVVKLDGDGQMDPALIPYLCAPILSGEADYVKGNRFYNPEDVSSMPLARLVGNSALSFVSKLSTGYWNLFDPTNGYTVIHARVAEMLPLDKVSKRYFFETDMLFRLNSIGAAVIDQPMVAVYGDEKSNMKLSWIFVEFLLKHIVNSGKRILYRYFVRDFSIASLELVLGLAALLFGGIFGATHWIRSAVTGEPATAGTVMLAALPVLVGVQLLLAFFNYDIASVPRRPLHTSLLMRRRIARQMGNELRSQQRAAEPAAPADRAP